MWSLHQRCSEYHKLPSEIFNIKYPILAYWFDETINWFGRWVESKLSERTKKNKRRYTLAKILGIQQYAKWNG